jgi:hypothetical protein
MFQVGLVMVRSLAIQEAREADVLVEPVQAIRARLAFDARGFVARQRRAPERPHEHWPLRAH